MDTVDTVGVVKDVKKKRTRKKLAVEPTTPVGELRKLEAEEFKSKKEKKVTEKWFELRGKKLLLMKKVETGAVFRTFIGSTSDKKTGAQLLDYIERLKKEATKKEVTAQGYLRLYRSV